MLKLTCKKCAWSGVFGDAPCRCGLSFLDFEFGWDNLPANVFVVDEIEGTGAMPMTPYAWSLK